MSSSTYTPRRELTDYVESGNLRQDLLRAGRLAPETIDLTVRVIRAYCSPRERKASRDHRCVPPAHLRED